MYRNMRQSWMISVIFALFLFIFTACGASSVGTNEGLEDPNQNQNQTELNQQDQKETPADQDSVDEEHSANGENTDLNENQADATVGATGKDGSEEQQAQTNEQPERRFEVNQSIFTIKPVELAQEGEKFVLLTFDDTPTAKSTNQILDILDKYQAKAIFFVNGHYAEPNLDLLKEIKNRGHIIGNHTWWHIYIRKESPEKVREEIVRLNAFIEEHLGERPKYFRPPFGQNSDVSLQVIKEEGMQTMNWSNGSLDWELKSADAIAKQVLSNIKNGDNILFHDKQTTADALDTILAELSKQGYQFVLPTEVHLPELDE